MKLTRRQTLKAGAGAFALSMVGGSLTAAPKKGGILRLGISGGSTSDSLDPATWSSQFLQIGLFGGVYNTLTEVMPDGSLTPELAESIEPSDGARIWTVKLRPGVEFHNGKTLDAGDVVATMNYHRGEDSGSAAKGIVDQITDVRAEDDLTVVFELSSGNADFPFVLNDYHLVILPAVDGQVDWQSGVGTGGYKLISFEPGVRMELERNPNYFKPDRAHFDGAILTLITDSAARQAALAAGEVDVINRVDLKTVHLLSRKNSIAIDEVTGTQHASIPMIMTGSPFDDLNVRMALKYGIDRQALVDTILLGHGAVANDHPIAPSNRYFNAELEQRIYDPDKAKYHLKQAGLDNLAVSLSAAEAAFHGAVDAAVLYKEHAAPAGIDIDVVREPNDGYWKNVWRNKPFCMCYWGGRPTEDWMFSIAYAADAKCNDTQWKNDRFNALLIEARAETDDAKRREMYGEMQMLVRDDGATVVPFYANYVDARSTSVAHDDQVGANWELDGWKVIERWWFA